MNSPTVTESTSADAAEAAGAALHALLLAEARVNVAALLAAFDEEADVLAGV